MSTDHRIYLTPTRIIDSDHPTVRDWAMDMAGDAADPVERAVRLYLAVRDRVRYNPYMPFWLPEHYQASKVLERGQGFCIPKGSLLCAVARVGKIPARIGFATVVNHLATKQLLEFQGTNRFVYHGFVEMYLEGKWVKCTPAFNRELCERHRVPALDFNGREDSLFHPYNLDNQQFMEYAEYHGTYPDVPVSTILDAWDKEYGADRVQMWKRTYEAAGAAQVRDFHKEEPV